MALPLAFEWGFMPIEGHLYQRGCLQMGWRAIAVRGQALLTADGDLAILECVISDVPECSRRNPQTTSTEDR